MSQPVRFQFSSEAVGRGHPDKIGDQISDALLDKCLEEDPLCKTAIEVAVGRGFVLVSGTLTARVERLDVVETVREVLRDIGYIDRTMDIHCETCEVIDRVERYIPSRLLSLEGPPTSLRDVPAGDQGMTFGYATDETSSLLPLTVLLAQNITKALDAAKRSGELPWVRSDTKAQVTVEYESEGGHLTPRRITNVAVTLQHDRTVSLGTLRTEIRDRILGRVLPADLIDGSTKYRIQPCGDHGIVPSGKFAGMTGRKIVADTYGGWGSHGGGALSGKDFRQVDRTGAYLSRWIAKSLVAAGFASRCSVQLAWCADDPCPISLSIDTYGTGKRPSAELEEIVRQHFDMRPGSLALEFGLTKPIFMKISRHGHFGDQSLPWEKPKYFSGWL
ncbi:hypothetical protein CLAIMM_14087 [Cladophialophora immunda]|nr:hypothetical protein CLAIMM_14087 [Cladophialophora immunda]